MRSAFPGGCFGKGPKHDSLAGRPGEESSWDLAESDLVLPQPGLKKRLIQEGDRRGSESPQAKGVPFQNLQVFDFRRSGNQGHPSSANRSFLIIVTMPRASQGDRTEPALNPQSEKKSCVGDSSLPCPKRNWSFAGSRFRPGARSATRRICSMRKPVFVHDARAYGPLREPHSRPTSTFRNDHRARERRSSCSGPTLLWP